MRLAFRKIYPDIRNKVAVLCDAKSPARHAVVYSAMSQGRRYLTTSCAALRQTLSPCEIRGTELAPLCLGVGLNHFAPTNSYRGKTQELFLHLAFCLRPVADLNGVGPVSLGSRIMRLKHHGANAGFLPRRYYLASRSRLLTAMTRKSVLTMCRLFTSSKKS